MLKYSQLLTFKVHLWLSLASPWWDDLSLDQLASGRLPWTSSPHRSVGYQTKVLRICHNFGLNMTWTIPSHSVGGWHVHGDCPACCLVENIWPGWTSSLRCRAGWSCQLEWLRPENNFLCDPSPFTLQEFLFIPFLLAFTCYIYFTWQVDKINITPVFPPVAYISSGRCWDWQNICTEGRAGMVCCITG